MTLDSFTVDTDRPRFSFDGEIRQTSAGIGLRGRFQAHDMPFDALVDYWPEAFLETGRGWITHNISDGVITRFDAALDVEPGTLEEGRITAASAAGTLAFEDASVHYLRPMPAVEGVGGSGRFTGESLNLTMNDGRIAGIVASRGTASLSDFHAESPHLSVTVEAEGPAADALALLDHPRLALMSKVGLQPRNVGGTVHTLFTVDLPADTTITAEQIELTAVARVSSARMEEIAGTVDMSEGALRLGIDEASMDLRGTARLQGVPATVSWQENFDANAPFARGLDVAMTVTPEDRAALGLDLAPYMEGSVGLDARYSDPGGGARPDATLLFDLTEARLGSPDLPWSKPAGEPGTLSVHAAVPPEGAIRLDRIEVEAGTLNAVGQATLARGLDHFSGEAPFAQGLDLSMTVTPEEGAAFGPDLAPYVQGSVVLDTHFTGPDGGEPSRVALSLDLTEARLDIPDLGWSKPAGEPGTASALAAFPPEGAIRLDRFEVEAGSLNAVGQATLARGFDHFSGTASFLQGLDAALTVMPQGGAPQGGTALGLDLAPFVQGSVALDARFSDPGGGAPPGATLLFDLTGARLEIPDLGWSKPAGEPGTLSVLAAFLPEGAIRLTRFEVDAGTLNAVGQATLARGFDHFSGDAPFVQGLDASVTVTPQGGRALGLDLAPYVQGGFALDARFSDPGGGAPPGATLLFDLTGARLEIPDLGWSKPAGEPGTLSVLAAFLPEGAIRLTRFEVEAGTLNAVGQATLARGLDHFGGDAPFVQGLDAALTVTPQEGTAPGLDLAPYVQGSFALDARFSDPGGGAPPGAMLLFDMTEARLEIPALYWFKPAGEAGTVSVRAAFPPEGAVRLTGVEVKTGTLYAAGQATLASGPGAVREIMIERMQHGATDITGTIETGGAATRVSVRGVSLDARPYLTRLMEEGAPQSGPLVLDLDVERVVTAANQQLTDVRARFETDPEGRHAGFMKGTLSSGAPLHFSLEPQAGKRLVTVRSRDAGAVARAFGIYDNAIGGDLLMEAVLHDDRPGRPVTGTVRIDRYQVADAPTLARLLTIATLTGIVDVLRGEGIAFSEFVLPFSIEDDIVTVQNARTSGFSLGVTAGGTVDLETDRVSISGTVVPAYSLNSLVGIVPVLGKLLTGGEGGGLFAATYRVGGTTEQPAIAVNPLSILAPGFLRGLFSFLEGDEPAASE